MTRIFLVLSGILIAVLSTSAQEEPIKEHALRPLADFNVAEKSWKANLYCGPYFVIPGGMDRSEEAMLSIYFESGKDPRKPGYIFGLHRRTQITVVLDETSEIPSAFLLGDGKWLILLSQVEYEKARPCVPEQTPFANLIAKRPS